MLFFYIRHGHPIYSPDQLTPLGHRQAEAAAKRLALFGLDKIYASTSNRAIQTAQPTCELLRCELEKLDFCNEGHAWAELTVDIGENRKQWAFAHPETKKLFVSKEVRDLGPRWYDHPAFVNTSYKQGIQRIDAGVDRLFETLGYKHNREEGCYIPVAHNDQRVALFAHQGFGLAFLSSLLDIPYPAFCSRFDMTHSGITVIEFKPQGDICIPKVLTLSSDSHLYREGLPLNYNNCIRF